VAEALVWLEHSALGVLMRTSSLWTYPIVNLLHIFGIAALFGSVAILDLRLLGVPRAAPLSIITDTAVPVATVGFSLAVITGLPLLATKSTEYIGNPYLVVKFAAIGIAVLNVVLLNFSSSWKARHARELDHREQRTLAIFGGVSLAAWITAISAGRLIAYW
jgi:hypothetical protein